MPERLLRPNAGLLPGPYRRFFIDPAPDRVGLPVLMSVEKGILGVGKILGIFFYELISLFADGRINGFGLREFIYCRPEDGGFLF